MFGPKRTVILARHPVPRNSYPARNFSALGLGGASRPFSFIVPFTLQDSITLSRKSMSDTAKGGKSFDLIENKLTKSRIGDSLVGRGPDTEDPVEEAFLHPIKVYYIVRFFFFILFS